LQNSGFLSLAIGNILRHMLGIDLSHYNEMLRYEKDMDVLRALALWITKHRRDRSIPGLSDPKQYVFDIMKFYSRKFAVDIMQQSSISDESLSLFHNSLYTLNRLLGISERDIARAGEQQRYRNSGFWEMRKVLGQFGDVAESAHSDGITHIITAAVSGCVIGEFLGFQISKKYGYSIPVDHMVFARRGKTPTAGHLPDGFSLSGNHILIADDAVNETITSGVMVKELRRRCPHAMISLMTVDIDPDTKYSGYLDQFAHVYLFDA